MKKQFDYLIVGAGLFGATFAHLTSEMGKKNLVIDSRPTVGGNVYTEKILDINVHKYGAHIFHTSNKKIWDFINKFSEFNRYTNCPIANYLGGLFNLPFNMNTFHQLWGVRTPKEALAIIENQRNTVKKEIGNIAPTNLEQQARLLVGDDIYNILIKEYTEKQWGRPCSQLSPDIIRRLPLRFTYDNNYFNDIYQGIPVSGYTQIVNKMLNKCEVKLNTDYFEDRNELEHLADKILYTGQLDRFFEYDEGTLQWRSLRFETSILEEPNYQGNAVVNYTSKEVPYTRIIEHKHFEMFGDNVYKNPSTVITKEYPLEWELHNEPFYPINDKKNEHLFEIYKEKANNVPNLLYGGRLAEYKYYDMAPTIESAINLFDKIKMS